MACFWKTMTPVCGNSCGYQSPFNPFAKFVKDKNMTNVPMLLFWFSRLKQYKHGPHLMGLPACLKHRNIDRYFKSYHFLKNNSMSCSRMWDVAFILVSWTKNLLSYNNVTLYWKFRMLLLLFLKGKVLNTEKNAITSSHAQEWVFSVFLSLSPLSLEQDCAHGVCFINVVSWLILATLCPHENCYLDCKCAYLTAFELCAELAPTAPHIEFRRVETDLVFLLLCMPNAQHSAWHIGDHSWMFVKQV